MRSVLAAASLLALAVVLFSDDARSMFSPSPVYTPTYSEVSPALVYGGVPTWDETTYALPVSRAVFMTLVSANGSFSDVSKPISKEILVGKHNSSKTFGIFSD